MNWEDQFSGHRELQLLFLWVTSLFRLNRSLRMLNPNKMRIIKTSLPLNRLFMTMFSWVSYSDISSDWILCRSDKARFPHFRNHVCENELCKIGEGDDLLSRTPGWWPYLILITCKHVWGEILVPFILLWLREVRNHRFRSVGSGRFGTIGSVRWMMAPSWCLRTPTSLPVLSLSLTEKGKRTRPLATHYSRAPG